jgi:chromosome segregation ATPase
MAIDGKHSRQSGWQVQADRLVLKHTVVPGLPLTATVPAPRRQTSEAAPQSVLAAADADRRSIERPPEEGGGPVTEKAAQPFSREETLEWIQNARKAVLTARAETVKAADERIAELEVSLEAAFERVAFLENENQSLEESLDAITSENLDLTNRLIEAETRSEEVRSELQSSEMTRAEYDLAAAAAERRIELLQNLTVVKEARLQKMEQARKKMQHDIKKLLTTTKTRDQALADAERRIFVLTELFEKLEFRLESGKTEAVSKEIHQALHPQPPRMEEPAAVQKPSGKTPEAVQKTGRQFQLWQRALDTDDWLLDGR